MSRLAMLKAAEHYVYRAFDSNGRLLYVGCSLDVEKRIKGHRASRAAWLPLMADLQIEGPYSYDEARAIEWEAIQTEGPTHNAQTPAAVAERTARRNFFNAVKVAAMSHGEPLDVAHRQALIATDIEFSGVAA